MRITAGRKIAYVVDCAFTEENVDRVVALAEDADVLFIEAAFLQEDCARGGASTPDRAPSWHAGAARRRQASRYTSLLPPLPRPR
jgi:ribonuclease Z